MSTPIGLDGSVHKYQVGTGTETLTGGTTGCKSTGWPELATLKPSQEKSPPALSIASSALGTYLNVGNGGYYGDAGDYQGRITAINLSNGSQRVFNTLCSNVAVHFTYSSTPDCSQTQATVWARPGVVYDLDTGEIYIASGNGDYAPSSYDWATRCWPCTRMGVGAGRSLGTRSTAIPPPTTPTCRHPTPIWGARLPPSCPPRRSPRPASTGAASSPSIVFPGLFETLGATIRVTSTVTNPIVVFLIYSSSGTLAYYTYVRLGTIANTTRPVEVLQYLPATTAVGRYYPLVAVVNATGSQVYSWSLANSYLVL